MHQSAPPAAKLNLDHLKAQCIGRMCFVFGNYYPVSSKIIFLLYLQKLKEKGQGKDRDVPGRYFSPQLSSKGNVSVFSMLATATASEVSKQLMPQRKGSAWLPLSRGLMLVKIPRHERWWWDRLRGIFEPGDS